MAEKIADKRKKALLPQFCISQIIGFHTGAIPEGWYYDGK
jgi:hypothetical protein